MRIYFFILLFVCLIFIGCKPEPCQPPIKTISSDLLPLLPDVYHPEIIFKNNNNDFWKFDQMIFHNDTQYSPNPCNPAAERMSLTYEGNIPIAEINYFLSSGTSRNILIHVGPDITCESIFFLNIDSMFNYDYTDTLTLNNEVFYDAYHRTESPFMCCTEIYYNKQYGVVGFKWEGEWFALETDSL